MGWYISTYKKLPDDLKKDCDARRGLYIVKKWNPHLTSISPFNIRNFIHVIIMNDSNW